MKLYGHPRWSSVKKALKVLENKNIKFDYYDLTKEAPSASEIKQFHEISGYDIKKFFNTSGMVYRQLELKDKLPKMSLEEKYEVLASDGMLIKRPLLVTDDKVLIGFKEVEYENI